MMIDPQIKSGDYVVLKKDMKWYLYLDKEATLEKGQVVKIVSTPSGNEGMWDIEGVYYAPNVPKRVFKHDVEKYEWQVGDFVQVDYEKAPEDLHNYLKKCYPDVYPIQQVAENSVGPWVIINYNMGGVYTKYLKPLAKGACETPPTFVDAPAPKKLRMIN